MSEVNPRHRSRSGSSQSDNDGGAVDRGNDDFTTTKMWHEEEGEKGRGVEDVKKNRMEERRGGGDKERGGKGNNKGNDRHDDEGNDDEEVCIPWLSRAFFIWILRYVYRGYSTPLHFEDMPPLQSRFKSHNVLKLAVKRWDEMYEAWEKQGRPESSQPTIYSLIWSLQKGTLLMGLALSTLQGLLNNAGRPVMLKFLIDAVAGDFPLSLGGCLGMAALFGLMVFAEGLALVNTRMVLGADLGTRY